MKSALSEKMARVRGLKDVVDDDDDNDMPECGPCCKGWDIFYIDDKYPEVIMKCDACGVLDSDDEAIIKALDAGLTIRISSRYPIVVR
jgi:hypothetical protein